MAAREIADSMWAELYGVGGDTHGTKRRSLLDYFHGRSSLATWMRAIVAQRHIDSVRSSRRFDPLEDIETRDSRNDNHNDEPAHLRMMEIFTAVLRAALAALSAKDRMRLGYYYRDELNLREIARVTGEHESTVSRKLERTRGDLRASVERELRKTHRMSAEQIQHCYDHAAADSPFRLSAELPPTVALSQKKERGSLKHRGIIWQKRNTPATTSRRCSGASFAAAPAASTADCIAPEVLAAYYDRTLSRGERSRVESHWGRARDASR